MKICYFGNAQSVHVARLAAHFAKAGHDVHLVSLHEPLEKPDGWTLHHFQSAAARYKDIAFCLNRQGIRELAMTLAPDVFHAHFLISYGFYAAATGLHPLVISAWGSDILVHPQRSARFRLMARYAVRQSDCVLSESTESTRVLTGLLKAPPYKVKTFPWGVDTLRHRSRLSEAKLSEFRASLGLPATARLVLSPRSLASIYDHETTLRSIKPVVTSYPDVVFVFLRGFGTSTYVERLRSCAKDLQLERNIFVVDRTLSPDEMSQIYECSEIVVSIPTSDSGSIALAEGMLHGLIPIVSDLETNRSVVRDGKNGFVIAIGDDVALAKRITYALEHRDECVGEFGAANIEFVERQRSWDDWTRKIERVYQELLRSEIEI